MYFNCVFSTAYFYSTPKKPFKKSDNISNNQINFPQNRPIYKEQNKNIN